MTQERAIELALMGHNIFLTGQAGTGKTYTLNKIIKALQKQGKNVSRTASTGIAATYLNGTTIHSFAGIGIKNKLSIDDLYKIKNNPFSFNRIKNTDVLIIDEISMLSHNTFDLVNEVLQFIKDRNKFFGGTQIIISGDFFQLSPVVKDFSQKNYCFYSKVWGKMDLKVCYLDKIYRQSDPLFIDLLNSIRDNKIEDKHYNLLENLKKNTNNIEKSVRLYPHNINVSIENNKEMRKTPGTNKIIQPFSAGVNFAIDRIKKNMPVQNPLIIRENAKIMLSVNKYKDGEVLYVNGTLATIKEIKEDEIEVVLTKNNQKLCIERYKWEEKEVTGAGVEKVVASVEQFPIKLAWALTIHKSQGCSIDYVSLNLSDVFDYNMGYVALSRCTSLEGIYLSGYKKKSLEIDPTIYLFDQEFKKLSKENE